MKFFIIFSQVRGIFASITMVMGQVRTNELLQQFVTILESRKALEDMVAMLPEPDERGVESRQIDDLKLCLREIHINAGRALTYSHKFKAVLTQYEIQ